jgi:hypothetical protein
MDVSTLRLKQDVIAITTKQLLTLNQSVKDGRALPIPQWIAR